MCISWFKFFLSLMILGLFPSAGQCQHSRAHLKEEVLQSFAKNRSVNLFQDHVIVSVEPEIVEQILSYSGKVYKKKTRPLAVLAFFQSEGHFEIYYYSVDVITKSDGLNFEFKPLMWLSPFETSSTPFVGNERALEFLTLGESRKKGSQAWVTHFLPIVKTWLSDGKQAIQSCRKSVIGR